MNLFLQWYPGDAAVVFAGRIVVEISFVIGLAGLLGFVALRRRPAARHALWLGVLIAVALAPLTLAAVECAGWMWTVRRPVMLDETAPLDTPPAVPVMRKGASTAVRRSDQEDSNSSAARETADDFG